MKRITNIRAIDTWDYAAQWCMHVYSDETRGKPRRRRGSWRLMLSRSSVDFTQSTVFCVESSFDFRVSTRTINIAPCRNYRSIESGASRDETRLTERRDRWPPRESSVRYVSNGVSSEMCERYRFDRHLGNVRARLGRFESTPWTRLIAGYKNTRKVWGRDRRLFIAAGRRCRENRRAVDGKFRTLGSYSFKRRH